MKKYLPYIFLFFITIQEFHSQENGDGVVALNLPVRNSLKFNRYVINPTFSFVREQNKYLSFSNKREWVEFDDAPQTYLLSYSGRFNENIGVGIGLFQQNYGILTTFGGLLNFAYNVILDSDQNLTFGANVGVYKSGIDEGNLVTNYPDPSLQNIPSNTLITINPGINYGTDFFDFGVAINNLALYNLKSSKLIEENPEQSIQGHIMYTGYIDSRGFFDESKFSSLVRSEFKKDKTIISGIMMLTVPKGIWAQAGYNSLYGVSAGVGLNITSQIALEYNYEKAIGDLSNFGNSHEFTLAYKFKNRYKYSYSGDDEEEALIIYNKKPKRSVATRKPVSKPSTNTDVKNNNDSDNKVDVKEQARLAEETKAKEAAEAKRIAEEENKAKALVEEQARLAVAELKAKEADEAKAKELAKEKAKLEAEDKLRLAAETKAKEEAEAKRLAEEAKAIADLEAKEKLEAEQKVDTVKLERLIIPVANDRDAVALESLAKLTENSKIEQDGLLKRLGEAVDIKQKDLDDLKEENDLSEQGIYKQPKPFKSVSAENALLESLKSEVDDVIESQNDKISQLEDLYNKRLESVPNKEDEVNAYYLKAIEDLKSEQKLALQAKEDLISSLDDIKVAIDFERKRRIKRAAYDNEEVRYTKDKAALKVIKENTPISSVPLEVGDFDFGEVGGSNNIQIVKDIKNVESGYYLVLAVHSDVSKRDDFLTKAVSAGQGDVNFFYDVNTSKYFIYYMKFDDVQSAKSAIDTKGNQPYNSKMSIVKIEN